MSYSFPVLRKGIIFKTAHLITPDQAQKLADKIAANRVKYGLAFQDAVKRGNGASDFSTNLKARLKQHTEESHILNFPSISFKLGDFSVQSRNSVTVCVDEHRSKIWTRLTCESMDKAPAWGLSVSDVRRFFTLAQRKIDPILKALAAVYGRDVEDSGFTMPRSPEYAFQLRAYNSTSSRAQDLLGDLSHGLRLTDALENADYADELRDYFTVVLRKDVQVEGIKTAIKSGEVDVFGYRSPSEETIFSARINEDSADLCGYGYDKGKLSKKALSQTATKDLLREYAQKL